jgi:hypothetical protein
MTGKGVSLTDLTSVKNNIAVVPETPALARAMIRGFYIFLVVLLGEQHYLARQNEIFVTALDQREFFYFTRLQKADKKFGPTRLLRFIHLSPQSVILGSVRLPRS